MLPLPRKNIQVACNTTLCIIDVIRFVSVMRPQVRKLRHLAREAVLGEFEKNVVPRNEFFDAGDLRCRMYAESKSDRPLPVPGKQGIAQFDGCGARILALLDFSR